MKGKVNAVAKKGTGRSGEVSSSLLSKNKAEEIHHYLILMWPLALLL